jgi:hypothetical protein
MARKGITYDAVANAARAIKARGQEPTIAAIRVECGDEGSYTTISTHLAKWRAEEMDKVDTRTLPPEVEDAMMTAVMSVWNVANKAASGDLAAIKQDHADEVKRLKGEADVANAEIAELEKKLASAEDEAASAKGQAVNAEKKLTAATGELEATKSLYKQLLESLKPQAASDKKAADTKPARQQATKAAPESKSGETH